MNRPLVLVDLDDCLFQTEGKCPPQEREHLIHAATAGNGRHSFMTRTQNAFVNWLFASAETVPVTARGSKAYQAVSIPFASGAIVANGAVVLDADGTPHAEWHALMQKELDRFAEHLNLLHQNGRQIAEALKIDVRSWLIEEADLQTYAVFKENSGTKGQGLVALEAAMPRPDGWTVHRNGNNLAYIPPPVSKRRAAAFLIERARTADPGRAVFGLGDSISDFSFLSLCDWWGAPRESQISRSLLGITPWFDCPAPNPVEFAAGRKSA
ncbi:hypothetical protein J4T87_0025685 (plasmid) [Rhizobium sp. T1473]|uniref:hypothetical protein n=1 Tax=Rhizobium sp. T1473 TaxID=555321 RepID=UPI001AAF8F41